jgi:ribulose-5-phosphate 4-epimerase/fuculose-1-phosphate aldolase
LAALLIKELDTDGLDQAREDLAAALRLAAHFGLSEGICNHFSLDLGDDTYLLNPHGRHWSLIGPADLLHINVHAPGDEAETTALNIHSAIHAGDSQARCVLHTHMPYATALSCLVDGRLRFVHQNTLRFWDDVSYDDGYNGLADTVEEGLRIAATMAGRSVCFLANHGVIVTGRSVAQAFDRLYYLERACEVQIIAMSTGQPMQEIGPNLAAKTKAEFDHGSDYSAQHFNAIKALVKTYT